MSRFAKIAAAAVGGFVFTLGLILLYWVASLDQSDCGGEECVLEYAAVVTAGIVAGALVGATCGYVVYALTARRP